MVVTGVTNVQHVNVYFPYVQIKCHIGMKSHDMYIGREIEVNVQTQNG